MAKRGRPVKDDAKRCDLNIRLTVEESEMLKSISAITGKSRTSIIIDAVTNKYGNLI